MTKKNGKSEKNGKKRKKQREGGEHMFRKGKWIFGMLAALVVTTSVTGCSTVDFGRGIVREIKEYKDNLCQEIKEVKDDFLEEIHDWVKEDEDD